MEKKLKLCPRCGAEAIMCSSGYYEANSQECDDEWIEAYYVICSNCRRITKAYKKPGYAIKAWNTSF